MPISKEMLDVSKMEGRFVQIMSKNMFIDKETGMQANYSQQAFLRGCDGMFIYYSFDPRGELTGFMPISEIMDVISVDHIKDMIGEDEDEEI